MPLKKVGIIWVPWLEWSPDFAVPIMEWKAQTVVMTVIPEVCSTPLDDTAPVAGNVNRTRDSKSIYTTDSFEEPETEITEYRCIGTSQGGDDVITCESSSRRTHMDTSGRCWRWRWRGHPHDHHRLQLGGAHRRHRRRFHLGRRRRSRGQRVRARPRAFRRRAR